MLIKDEGIIYAYIFGSFLDPISIRDIDIGIYLKEINMQDVFDYELKLAVFVVSLNLF